MKNRSVYIFLLTLFTCGIAWQWNPLTTNAGPASSNWQKTYYKRPLRFEANRGQAPSQVLYRSSAPGYSIDLTHEGATLLLQKESDTAQVLKLRLKNGNPQSLVESGEQLPGYSSYFIGNDPSKWLKKVPHYRNIHYRQVYPGTDLVLYGNQQQLEYDFVLQPGADPEQVVLTFEGAGGLEVTKEGDLSIQLVGTTLVQRKPVIYQDIQGERRAIEGGYKKLGDGEVGFWLSAYEADEPLVIDPVLIYSGFYGTADNESAAGIVVNSAGVAFITGFSGPGFEGIGSPAQDMGSQGSITPNQVSMPNQAFITRIDPDGTSVMTAFLGGSVDDTLGEAIALDSNGAVHVTGATFAADFPVTPGAFQSTNNGGQEAFYVRLPPDLDSIDYATYLGGDESEAGSSIAVDPSDTAIITGFTNTMQDSSVAFPLKNPLPGPGNDCGDCPLLVTAFVARFDPSMSGESSLIYSTYLGGTFSGSSTNSGEFGQGIATDSLGDVYVTGSTDSMSFPTVNPQQSALAGSQDAFVTKLHFEPPSVLSIVYSTYLGGSDEGFFGEDGFGIAVDGDNSAYVAGVTDAVDFPTTPGAFDEFGDGSTSSDDAFVTKFSPAGDTHEFSTYISGSGDDAAFGITVDVDGKSYITGDTDSTDFPEFQSASSFGGMNDAFLTVLVEDGSGGLYSTYLGGSANDGGNSVALGPDGDAYVAGETSSMDFPVTGNSPATRMGSSDGFVARISDNADLEVEKTVDQPFPDEGDTVTFMITVTNLGPDDTPILGVTDQLPAGLTFVSASPAPGTSYDENTGEWLLEEGLAADDSATLQISATVDPGTATTTLFNTAIANILGRPDPDFGNNSDTVAVQVQGIDLRLTKTVDNEFPQEGEIVTFTVTVFNDDVQDAPGVEITDQLPEGVTFVSASQPTYDPNTGVWDVGFVDQDDDEILTIQARVDAETAGSTIVNEATITASDIADPDIENNTASASIVPQASNLADLSITKTVDNATPNPGQNVTFSVTLRHVGGPSVEGVQVQDSLPEGLAFISANPPEGTTYNNVSGVWFIGNVSGGSNLVLTITARVDAANGSVVTNTATISAGASNDPTPQNNSASVTLTVGLQADLALTLTSSPVTGQQGQILSQIITVTNQGPATATGILVLLGIPSGTEFIASTVTPLGNCSRAGSLVRCAVGNLANGESAVINVQVRPQTAGFFVASASVTSTSSDPVGANNAADLTTQIQGGSDLSISKTGLLDRAVAGRAFTYAITVTNVGSSPVTGVSVTDMLPAGMSFVSAGGSSTVSCTGTLNISCSLGQLLPQASVVLNLTVNVNADVRGTVTNTATVAGVETDPLPLNNTAQAPTLAVQAGDANADGVVNAADLVALILEIGDGDGNLVGNAAGGTFAGNAALDVNGDGLISNADIASLFQEAFGGSGQEALRRSPQRFGSRP